MFCERFENRNLTASFIQQKQEINAKVKISFTSNFKKVQSFEHKTHNHKTISFIYEYSYEHLWEA